MNDSKIFFKIDQFIENCIEQKVSKEIDSDLGSQKSNSLTASID